MKTYNFYTLFIRYFFVFRGETVKFYARLTMDLIKWYFTIYDTRIVSTRVILFLGVSKNWSPHEKLPRCSLRTLLTRFLDITTPPTPNMLQFFATCANNPVDKKNLTELATVTHIIMRLFRTSRSYTFVHVHRTAQLTRTGVTTTCPTYWKFFESFHP